MSPPDQDSGVTGPENATSLGERAMETPTPVSLPPSPADSSEQEDSATAREPKVSGAKTYRETQRDRMRDRQVRLDHHRESVLAGIAKLNADLDKIPEEQVDKRIGVRSKIRVFEQQLDAIGEEQASLDRQEENLKREDAQAQIEDAAKSRQQLQISGAEVATKLRQGLAVVGQLSAELTEFRQRERIAKDILRSAAPARMSECPDFDWAVGVDANFQAALSQVLGECTRSYADLRKRVQAKENF
jgi:hypothetical protein